MYYTDNSHPAHIDKLNLAEKVRVQKREEGRGNDAQRGFA